MQIILQRGVKNKGIQCLKTFKGLNLSTGPEILLFFITHCVYSGLFKIPSVAMSLFYMLHISTPSIHCQLDFIILLLLTMSRGLIFLCNH